MAIYLDKFKITIDENGNEVKTKTSQKEITSFLVRNKGLKIRPTKTQFIALEKNEVYINGEVITDEEYYQRQEAEAKKKEQERVAQLNMTRGDFLEGLILAQNKDENDIIDLIQKLPYTDMEKKVFINRVKNALDFYRGYPVIDVLCGYLNVSTDNMTKFFETKDYNYLKAEVVVEDGTN